MKTLFAILFLMFLLILLTQISGPAFSNEVAVAFNQKFIEGRSQVLIDSEINTDDIDEVFRHVFFSLGRSIVIYPSSNYYYFKFISAGKEFWGHIGFSPEDRSSGSLNFVYYEFFETAAENKLVRSKKYGRADGLFVERKTPRQYLVTYRGKSAIFNLFGLEQAPPRLFPLKKDEKFIERTFDESGYQFFLIFNSKKNYFMWVLNEEAGVPDGLKTYGNLIAGEKSKFIFYKDGARKILVGVSERNLKENNYYDGPHDQLADDYAEESRVSEYIQLAYPWTKGRIDEYGWFAGGKTGRFALAPYYIYSILEELQEVMRGCDDKDFYVCITNNRNRK